MIAYQYTHKRLTALFPRLPRWAGTRKVKRIWILLKQETVSGSGISWAICKSASCSRQTTTPAPHHSVFVTGRMPFLPPNQQRESTDNLPVTHKNANEADRCKGKLLWHAHFCRESFDWTCSGICNSGQRKFALLHAEQLARRADVQ